MSRSPLPAQISALDDLLKRHFGLIVARAERITISPRTSAVGPGLISVLDEVEADGAPIEVVRREGLHLHAERVLTEEVVLVALDELGHYLDLFIRRSDPVVQIVDSDPRDEVPAWVDRVQKRHAK